MSPARFSHITICIEKAETSFEGKTSTISLNITPVCLTVLCRRRRIACASTCRRDRSGDGGLEEPQRRDSLNELKTACLHGGRLTHSEEEEEEKFASKDGDAAERGRELTGSPAV